MRIRRRVSLVPLLVFCPVSSTRSIISACLSFQSLTTIKFSNPFVLITIRNAGGWAYPLSYRHPSFSPSAANCRLSPSVTPLECALTSRSQLIENTATLSPLECAVTQNDSLTPLECAVAKKGGGRGDCLSNFRRVNSGLKPCGGNGRGGSSSGSQTRRGTFAGCRAAC